MRNPVLNATPLWTAIAVEQFRATGLAIRREAAIASLILAAVTLLVFSSYFFGGGESFDFHLSAMGFPVVVLGLFIPMAVWKGEEPARRSYLWSLPVDRARHTLIKAFGGWMWFMTLVGAYLLWAVALALLTGGHIGADESRVLLGDAPAGVPLSDVNVYVHRQEAPTWMWLVPFTAATTTYLLGTLIVLASDYPWRWFAAFVFTHLLLAALSQAGQAGSVGQVLGVAVDGPWGMEVLYTGVTNQETVLSTPDGRQVVTVLDVPLAGRWIAATMLWLGLALVGVLITIYRHPDG